MRIPLFAVLLTHLLTFCVAPTPARAEIAWERSYDAALLRSRATGQPILIDFFTTWCGWCKKLDADVYPDARVQQLSGNFVMLKLDAEREGAAAARKFSVRGYPTLLFLTPGQQEIQRVAGYLKAPDFAAMMQQGLGKSAGVKNAARIAPPRPAPAAAPVAAPGANFKAQQLRVALRMASGRNLMGVMLLDENGTVTLDAPVKKAKIFKKNRSKVAPGARKVAGY